MAMEYFNYIKAKAHLSTAEKSEAPVLSDEDEQFLHKITSDENPPPLPARPDVTQLREAGETRGNDAQLVLTDEAQNTPLPETPDEIAKEAAQEKENEEPKAEGIVDDKDIGKGKEKEKKSKRPQWSWMRRDSRDRKQKASKIQIRNIDAYTNDLLTIGSRSHSSRSRGHSRRS